ncbi:hypothetical protein AGABI2DRAFT_62224 [Agaricus bisporus var. bisporus H97]|uniref:hypothetical protein n=1 Tax=Agaricus bisporus var. bisporus (strain H97 / ATCC MYA-4626 / FGSC 10389) TaxID=936046 RepID=UPI00029F7A2D|nr:hypothetical protein AGABI2DRAFT_62224 [Agaricus bisporus var. bisporus H97]EKV50797.1 hypothetical protein AGABI2DRAFT_62224 [Agaricus bisporus var. bisporus H97]
MSLVKRVPNAREFYPMCEPEIGTKNETPILFKPLTIRGVTFRNRIWLSPMCQYSSDDGHATDHHLVHLGSYATHGVGAIVIEATAVVPEGRISPEDSGLWKDSQIAPLKRIVDFAHAHGAKIGIQIGHAGRKASTVSPFVTKPDGKHALTSEEAGWPDQVYAASAIPFVPEVYPDPQEATEEYIKTVIDAFVAAAKRAEKAGFDFIEIHAAHGYFLNTFLSPLSNTRTDKYGGSLENRMRLTIEVAQRLREAWPADKPLFIRITAVDWAEGPEKDESGKWLQWGIEQSIVLAKRLQEVGVDLVDVSSGGLWAAQKITVGPGYQSGFAAQIKKAVPNLLISAVGAITEPEQAETYLKEGRADVITMARELLRNPSWPLYASKKLGVEIQPSNQQAAGWFRYRI